MRAQKKVRSARVLFTKDAPFKPKIIASKVAYRRLPKHKNRGTE